MKYPRNEIWFKKVYQEDIKKEAINIIYRPEDRICNGKNEKCFKPGEELILRVLEKSGDDKRGIKPEFVEGLIKRVRVKRMKKISIDDLTNEDFVGSYPDVHNNEQLRYHLGKIYNQIPSYFKTVTKIEIEYLN